MKNWRKICGIFVNLKQVELFYVIRTLDDTYTIEYKPIGGVSVAIKDNFPTRIEAMETLARGLSIELSSKDGKFRSTYMRDV